MGSFGLFLGNYVNNMVQPHPPLRYTPPKSVGFGEGSDNRNEFMLEGGRMLFDNSKAQAGDFCCRDYSRALKLDIPGIQIFKQADA